MYPPETEGNESLFLLKQDVSEDGDDNGIVQNISPELKQPQTERLARPKKKTQKGRLFKGLQWTNVVATGIKSVHPFYSFGFTINTSQARSKTAVFSCKAYCRFKDCPVTVTVEVKDEKTLKADVLFQGGEVCHNTKEIKTRPVRGHSRDEIAEQLETKMPRSLYLDSLNKIPEKAFQAGCRDEAPSKEVLKNIAWSHRKKDRPHLNEMASLQILIDRQQGLPNEVLQRVLLHPKGIMLWSQKTLIVFYQWCKDDIVYFDATGSIISKDNASATPYYVYEIIVRNPFKGSSPLPTATFVTCDHTTASVTYFVQAFQTELTRMYGSRANKRPVMIICDGSLVLLQSIAITFCRASLEDLLERYFQVITGQLDTDNFNIPILHRCLSHIMKNAKDLCKKRLEKHYKFGMHIFGLLACSSNLKDFDGIILSATVVFKSPCSGPEVQKHLQNLKLLINQTGNGDDEEKDIIPEDYKECCLETLDGMAKDQRMAFSLNKQNYTEDNCTQGIMEKSQWDLKRIRFDGKRLTRLDDFVLIYQRKHDGLLREYGDVVKKRKSYRVETEKWKKISRKQKGFYVTPQMGKQVKQDYQEEPPDLDVPTEQTEAVTTQSTEDIEGWDLQNNSRKVQEEEKGNTLDKLQVTALWKRKETEVVVAVIPSQIKGNNFIVHHSELKPLEPHQWLTGEVNFDNYQAIVWFVNVGNVHWKFLYLSKADSFLYLVDPARNTRELEESKVAAQKFREFFKMRRTAINKTDWVDIKLQGEVVKHPVQKDTNCCGVIVILMAKAFMEPFPKKTRHDI
uniref:Ubiquitin-like protease family profile domain-containing protein n=1 Tax=Nothobranchius furzeri TaxID=105023 RepID=A0A1A8B0C6_NOTFU